MAKRSQYKMLYRSEWEAEETFKDWILPVPDDHRKAQCKYCGIKLSAYYAGLCSHALDKKHVKNVSAGGNAAAIRPLLMDHVDKEFSDTRSVEAVSGCRSTSVNESDVNVGRRKMKCETSVSKQENLSKHASFLTMPGGNGDESEFLKMECETVDEKSLAVLTNASAEKSRFRKKQTRISSPAQYHPKQAENETVDGSQDSQSDADSEMNKGPGICETSSSMDDGVLESNANLLSAVKLKALSPELSHSDATGEPAVKRRKLDTISEEEFIAEATTVLEVKRELLEDGALMEEGLSPESVSEETEVLQRKRKTSKSKIDWKRYKKAYRREWELDPALSEWVAPIDGDKYKAACRFCGCVLRAHYTDLQQHRSTAKHSRNAYWYQVKSLNPDAADNCMAAYEGLMEQKEDSCGQAKESKISACYMLSKSPWSRYRKRYRKQWESDPQFQGWIASVPGDDTKARCKYCCILLRAHLADLKNHSRTTKHANNIAYGKPFPDSSTASRPGIIRTSASLKPSVFNRKKKSSTKNASILNRADNFDLNRPDDSLAPIGSLTNLTTFGWSSSSLPETTLILPKNVHLDEHLAASLPRTSPAAMFRVKKEPGTAQTSPIKKRKEKLQVQMTPEECNENSLQSLTKSVTLWEFLMMKVEKSHPNSTRPKLETVLLEFKALQEQVKGLSQQQLTPLAADNKAKDSHQNDVLVIESEELAFCLGVPVGAYKIRDTTNPRMNRNINLLGNATRRRTKHSSTAGSVALDQSHDQIVITNSVHKLIAAGDSEIQPMVIPSDQLQGVKLIGYDFDRQYGDNLFTVNGHYEGEGDVQLYVLPISEEMDQETLNTLMQGAPVTK